MMDFPDFFFIALLIVTHIFTQKYIRKEIVAIYSELLIHAAKFKLAEGTHPIKLYKKLETLTTLEEIESYSFLALMVIGTVYFPVVHIFGYCVEIFTTFSAVHFLFFYKNTRNTPSVPGESKLWREGA